MRFLLFEPYPFALVCFNSPPSLPAIHIVNVRNFLPFSKHCRCPGEDQICIFSNTLHGLKFNLLSLNLSSQDASTRHKIQNEDAPGSWHVIDGLDFHSVPSKRSLRLPCRRLSSMEYTTGSPQKSEVSVIREVISYGSFSSFDLCSTRIPNRPKRCGLEGRRERECDVCACYGHQVGSMVTRR